MRTLTRQKLRGFRALRSRRNPTTLAPAGVAQRSWTDQLGREKSELRSALFLLRKQLLDKGVAEGSLPTPDQIAQHAGEASVIVASSQYADLAEQSKLLTPTATVADEVLGFSPGGIFEKVTSESLAKSTKSAMVSKLNARREIALSKRSSAGKEVKAAEQAAKDALFERFEEEERRRLEEQGEEAEVEERISREDVKALAAAMKADAVAEKAPKTRRSGSGKPRTPPPWCRKLSRRLSRKRTTTT